MPWALAGAGAAVLGGIGSYLANSSANDRANAIQSEQMQQWLQLNIPDPAEQKVAMQQFISAGTLTPALQSAIKQDPTEFNKIVTDPGLKGAQDKALASLEDIGNQGGLRLQDKATLQQALLNNQARARGNRNAIAAQMAQRGLSGSGFDVAAQLQGQQGEADQNAQNSLSVAANAQDRALQAIEGAGTMAGQQQQQDFNQQAQRATAADRINQFNTQNAQNVNAANTNIQNQAQLYNLNNAQDLSNRNTQLSNSQQLYNKSLSQQQYENKIRQLQGQAGTATAQSNLALNQGKNLGNLFSNVGGALNNTGGVIQNAGGWDNFFNSDNSSPLYTKNQMAIQRIKNSYPQDEEDYS